MTATSTAAERAGLTDEAAAEAYRQHGPNVIPEARPPGVVSRVVAQLRDPMILLLLGAAILTATLQDYADLSVILAVIVLNTGVGVVQELRAEKALTALRRLAAPHARVVRSGRQTLVAASDVVPGDLVVLEAGDVVPADLQLTEAVRLQVDEAALTGESIPVEVAVDSRAGEPAGAVEVYAGTVVTTGRGRGVVTRTGPSSALGKIAGLLSGQRPRPTPLQRRLAGLSRTLSIVVLALSAVVALSGLARGLPLAQMVVTAVSLTVAAVPESLPAVVTLALAIGAHRMARRSAVVRRLAAVETLGAVTVVAADKTGTLTEGTMLAERVWTPAGEYVGEGRGYEPRGRLVGVDGHSEPLNRLLRDVVLCNDADLRPPDSDDGSWASIGDPLEAALLALAAKGGTGAERTRDLFPRLAELPFDSGRKRMTTVHRDCDPGRILVVSKGAPEQVLGPSDHEARAAATALADQGFRVIAVADLRTAWNSRVPTHDELERLESGTRLAGLVAITDPVRSNAADVVRRLDAAGVELVMITGDAPGTAKAVARRLGLDGPVVTGDDLEPDADARVYARIRPEQKLDIVKALQRRHAVVAMTGDGVNDGPALRRADIGVAMGRGGTEVARQAADLVLTDDDLGTVMAAIAEGRRIYANVRTFLRYAMSGGLAEVLVMMVGPLTGLALPLLPAQILWINMLTHGLPGVAIGAEPADPHAMRERPRPPSEHVLGGGLWPRIVWTGSVIAAFTLGVALWSHAHGGPWQTMAFLVLGLSQLGVALALRKPSGATRRRPRFLDLAVLTAALLQLGAPVLPPLQALLGLAPVSPFELAGVVVVSAVPGLAIRVFGRR